MIGKTFIYTLTKSDWRYGRECLVIDEIGGCWQVKVVGTNSTSLMNKSLFPMKEISEEEIKKNRNRKFSGIF